MKSITNSLENLWFSNWAPSTNYGKLALNKEEAGVISFTTPFGPLRKELKITLPNLSEAENSFRATYKDLESQVSGEVVFQKKEPFEGNTLFVGKPTGCYERLTWYIILPRPDHTSRKKDHSIFNLKMFRSHKA